MKLIGITGYAGVGKDTLCAALQRRRPDVFQAAFADALKAELVDAFGCDLRLFTDPELKERSTPALAAWRCSNRSFVAHLGPHLCTAHTLRPRFVMQQWGDWRKGFDPDYWIKNLEHLVTEARTHGARAAVITDVRFLNEALWLRNQGGKLWRITRAGVVPRSGHASEWELEDTSVDLTIRNDSTTEQLEHIALAAYDDLLRDEARA